MAGIRVAHAAGSQPATTNITNVDRRAERSRAESMSSSVAAPGHNDTSGFGIGVWRTNFGGERRGLAAVFPKH